MLQPCSEIFIYIVARLTGPVPLLFRVISCEEGKALAESWNAAFMESSAKENQVRAKAKHSALVQGEFSHGSIRKHLLKLILDLLSIYLSLCPIV